MSVHRAASGAGCVTRLFRGLGLVALVLAVRAEAADLTVMVHDAAGNPLEDAVVLALPLDAPPEGAVAGDAEPPTVTIAQSNKQFDPHVSAIRVGTAADFPNRDNILHNVYSFSNAKRFQLPLYKDRPPGLVTFDKPGVVILGCNIHDWMVAYVYVAETPYFAKSGADGSAILTQLPPGSYRIRAWHPRRKRRGSSPDSDIQITTADPEPMAFSVALKPEWRPRKPPE